MIQTETEDLLTSLMHTSSVAKERLHQERVEADEEKYKQDEATEIEKSARQYADYIIKDLPEILRQ